MMINAKKRSFSPRAAYTSTRKLLYKVESTSSPTSSFQAALIYSEPSTQFQLQTPRHLCRDFPREVG